MWCIGPEDYSAFRSRRATHELGAHSGRGGSHGFEHMLLIRGLALRTSERGSILSIDRLNGERIRLSQAHDTAFDGGGSRVCRTQMSWASGPVIISAGERPISRRSCRICASSIVLRNGDCSIWMVSACRSVPSDAGSVVLLLNSEITTTSLSVRAATGVRCSQKKTAPITGSITPAGDRDLFTAISTPHKACEFQLQLGSGLPSGAPARVRDTALRSFREQVTKGVAARRPARHPVTISYRTQPKA